MTAMNVYNNDHQCPVCRKQASLRCSVCNTVWYCCKEHQIIDWKKGHKLHCNQSKMYKQHVPSYNSSQTTPTNKPPTILFDYRKFQHITDKRGSDALIYQDEELRANPECDYIFMRGSKSYPVWFSGSTKKAFKSCRERAAKGDESAIRMMYRVLKGVTNNKRYKGYGINDLRNQLNTEYGKRII
eukprot:12019_1